MVMLGSLFLDTKAFAVIAKDTTAGDKNIDGTSGTASPSFPVMTVASGDLLTALISQNISSTGAVTSITDGTNTWHQVGTTCIGSGTDVDVWYAANAVAGSTTVTVNKANSSATMRAVLSAWTGVLASLPLDITGTCNTGTSTTPASSPILPGQSNELIVGTCNSNQVSSGTSVAAPFISLTSDTNHVNLPAYDIQTSAVSATMTWTMSPSNIWGCLAASFKSAATPTPTPTSTQTSTPTPTATPTVTPIPTPIPSPVPLPVPTCILDTVGGRISSDYATQQQMEMPPQWGQPVSSWSGTYRNNFECHSIFRANMICQYYSNTCVYVNNY